MVGLAQLLMITRTAVEHILLMDENAAGNGITSAWRRPSGLCLSLTDQGAEVLDGCLGPLSDGLSDPCSCCDGKGR